MQTLHSVCMKNTSSILLWTFDATTASTLTIDGSLLKWEYTLDMRAAFDTIKRITILELLVAQMVRLGFSDKVSPTLNFRSE